MEVFELTLGGIEEVGGIAPVRLVGDDASPELAGR
jgi:hypothetical protein